MLHQNEYAIEKIAAQRRQQFLAEARTPANAGPFKTNNRRFIEQFLVSLAGALINAGEKIQGRYEPRSGARLSPR